MANYAGNRRGMNVSEYTREINGIPGESTNEESYPMEDDLAMFTNTHFFDFESGQNTDFQAKPAKPATAVRTPGSTTEDITASTSPIAELSSLDFIPDFGFPEFTTTYPSTTLTAFTDGIPLQPLQNGAAAYAQSVSHQQEYGHNQTRIGEKRRSESQSSGGRPLYEEVSRVAAEEDKRRRNTAASARFRIKKKQREQALEKSAKEMTEKVTALEGRIQQLETENKWLKGMILEKNGGSDQIAALLEKGLGARETEPTKEESKKSESS